MKINSEEFKIILDSLSLKFNKFCTIELIVNSENGTIYYRPQLQYNNVKHYPYLENVDDNTKFCKFKPNLPDVSGLYIWVVNDEIVYIGEAVSLKDRFNNGYGQISPRNCFKGGQSTNIRMNMYALSEYEKNNHIDIYICESTNHVALETELLKRINTKCNIQNN